MEKNNIETLVVKPKLSIFNNEIEHELISLDYVEKMDSKYKELEKYMTTNCGYGKSDIEKDELYSNAKELWNEYATSIRESIYNFYLNRKQYQYIITLLRDKLEYNVDTVFIAIDLTNMLGVWVNDSSVKDDITLKGYPVNATEITYIYHLISKHKEKGLTDRTYRFAEILRRIGEISKIVSYYDNIAKTLSKEIQQWVSLFEDPIEDSTKIDETN